MAAELPSLAEEIGELARIALDLGQRHDVPVAERLAYHRRKATVLSAIAERDQVADAAEVADLAWQHVRELEAEAAAGDASTARDAGPTVRAGLRSKTMDP
jgi:hypothetical protein